MGPRRFDYPTGARGRRGGACTEATTGVAKQAMGGATTPTHSRPTRMEDGHDTGPASSRPDDVPCPRVAVRNHCRHVAVVKDGKPAPPIRRSTAI